MVGWLGGGGGRKGDDSTSDSWFCLGASWLCKLQDINQESLIESSLKPMRREEYVDTRHARLDRVWGNPEPCLLCPDCFPTVFHTQAIGLCGS